MQFVALVSALSVAGIVSATPCLALAESFDHAAFCAEKTERADNHQLEAGVWLDEFTRNDTVNVHCSMRMIEFRRYLDMPSGELDDAWRQREKIRWNSAHCSDPDWYEAIRAGWTIASTLITTTGERIWYTARCR
ncbi:MAG: hypothetical protein ACKVP3_22490 [Hyphomicrobiaceae bacterium]